MNLESELKNVLRRTEPPPGFSERVMARWSAADHGGGRRRGRRRSTITRALAAAALIAVTLGGWGLHAALRARNEVLIAMRIASQKVAHAQEEVNRR